MTDFRIRLSQGFTATVDGADEGLVAPYRWYVHRVGDLRYAISVVWRNGRNNSVLLHRLLLGFPDSLIDHRDGDGLNNRRSNLRAVTCRQNHQNQRAKLGASPYKGVSWSKQKGAWNARIRAGDRRLHLGFHDDPTAAARAYDAAAREHFGEYAALNFPHPGERGALTLGLAAYGQPLAEVPPSHSRAIKACTWPALGGA